MLNVLTSPKRFLYSLITILTVTILSACTSTPTAPEDIPPALFSQLQNDAAYFLKKDKQLGNEKKSAWQFVALQALVAEGKFTLADSIIEYLHTKPLSETEKVDLTLLIADKQYRQNNATDAQLTLDKLAYEQLSALGYIYYLKLQTVLYVENNNHLGASDTLLLLTPLLSIDEEKQQYNDMLLAQLTLLPDEILNQYPSTEEIQATIPLSSEQVKQGWYALGNLYQRYQLRANQLLRALENWTAHYPTHPALAFIPTQLSNISEVSPYQPENIAVLIPLSGGFEEQGRAIQYGLLHAFYKQQNDNQQNALSITSPKLHFYDTNIQSLEQIVAEFKEKRIDFVIGPLLKKEVDALLPLIPDLPALTFNSADNEQTKTPSKTTTGAIDWHYAFPLSPEEEAKQAAQLIALQTHKNPLLLAPNSVYGQRIANAFKAQWLALNKPNENSDTQAEIHFFNGKAQLAQLMGVVLQTDKSKSRIKQIKMLTNLPLKTEVRSRRDIDAIYIVSNRDELNLIKPFIDVSISPFAPSIPLYASSRSHIVDHDGKQNRELEKLTFSDSAYLLDTNNVIFNEIQQVWPAQSFSTLRLFALGYDTYQLIEQLIPLQNINNYTYQGLTGELSLDQHNIVQAKLGWAQYQQGKSVEINTPLSSE